jgi:chromatin remodeling complex protein RSC6
MAKKDKTPKTVSKTTTPTTDVAPAATTPEETVVSLGESFTDLLGQLQTLRTQLTSVTGQVRALQKRADRELKNAQKASKKGKRAKGNRAPSGFVKPTKISSELATFLGKAKGTEMARTEVTREINGYIRQHNLQDPKNGRIILADTKLRKLLKLNKSDELTYFNLQRYMSPHFEKKNAKVDTSN